MEPIRLQKYLASKGVASRRKAEEIILAGRVSVNGEIIRELGTKVREEDSIEVDGKAIQKVQENIYIMLNKPTGYITSVRDQFNRPTVLDLVKDVKERIYPVGRLDYDTSGLIILSNDGEFTYRLTHPKHETNKVYIAEIKGVPTEEEIYQVRSGLVIDGHTTSPAGFEILERKPNSSVVKITIHEGRNRQVRKMCAMIYHPVINLQRVAVGPVLLGELPLGKWRHLSEGEIKELESES